MRFEPTRLILGPQPWDKVEYSYIRTGKNYGKGIQLKLHSFTAQNLGLATVLEDEVQK